MDCPVGVGSAQSIIDALVRRIKKNGGQVILKSHVDEICTKDGQAVGVRLKNNPNQMM